VTRKSPEFVSGKLEQREHEITNAWLIPGDTPDAVRVYTQHDSLGPHQDLPDITVQNWTWSGLPSGTTMGFDVSCVWHANPPEELHGHFYARTTGPPSPGGGEGGGGGGGIHHPPYSMINFSMDVRPYLQGVTLGWDNQSNDFSVDVHASLHDPAGTSTPLPVSYGSTPGTSTFDFIHSEIEVPGELLRYSTDYTIAFTVKMRYGNPESTWRTVVDATQGFTTDDDPRFNDNPGAARRTASIRDQPKGQDVKGWFDPSDTNGPRHRLTDP
jgi:hypothetical protein